MKSGPDKPERSRSRRRQKSVDTSTTPSEPSSVPAPAQAIGPPLKIERIDQVFDWLIQGDAPHQLIQAIAQTWPEEEPLPLIVAAAARLDASADVDANKARGWCFEAYRACYARMFKIGNYDGALRAIEKIQKLIGGD